MGDNDPIQENEEIVHEIEDDAGDVDDDSVHKSVQADDPSIDSVETVDDEAKYHSTINDEIVHEQPPRLEDA